MTGTTTALKTADGVMDVHAYHPEGAGPWPAVIFYMDGLGVRPALHAMAQRLAKHGYFVVMPNLYHRVGPMETLDPKKVFGDPDGAAKLRALVGALTSEMLMRDAGACLDFIATQPQARADRVGCMGYCMGGMTAFRTAGTFGDRIAAAASIHGGRLATDQPDSPHLLAARIRARLYFAVADKDASCPPEQQEKLEAALRDAGVRYQLEQYPGATHGFAVTDVPIYNEPAAEKHWERVLALFRDALGTV